MALTVESVGLDRLDQLQEFVNATRAHDLKSLLKDNQASDEYLTEHYSRERWHKHMQNERERTLGVYQGERLAGVLNMRWSANDHVDIEIIYSPKRTPVLKALLAEATRISQTWGFNTLRTWSFQEDKQTLKSLKALGFKNGKTRVDPILEARQSQLRLAIS